MTEPKRRSGGVVHGPAREGSDSFPVVLEAVETSESHEDFGAITVERSISAPPQKIFDLLANPSRHHEIDGSGSVVRQKSGPTRLALGSTFVMSMKFKIRYSTASTVVEFQENRRIAWQTYSTIKLLSRWGGGRIWSYELQPLEDGTLVSETWDPTHEVLKARKNLEKDRTRGYMVKAIEETLAKLEQVMTVPR
jgi:uncharacterized protein YndB with AHSA1/START domain